MTRALFYALLVSTAASAADPEAALEPGAIPAEIRDASHPSFRVRAGKSLGLRLKGPASLRFAVSTAGRAASAAAELDGKVVSSTPVKPGNKPEEIVVAVSTGKHVVALRWAGDATADARVAIIGVQLRAAKPLMALRGLDLSPSPVAALPLPLPGAQAKNVKPAAPPPLPLPATSDRKQPSEMLSFPGAAPPPAAAKPVEEKPTAGALQPTPKPAATAALPPPAARPAATASAPGGTRTGTAQNQAATPPAVPAMGLADRGVALRGPQLWSVTALLGGDRSSEDYTAATSGTRLGLLATRALSSEWMLEGQLQWRNSTQEYAVQQGGTGGRVSPLDENRFDVGVSGGYDFGPRLVPSGRLLLMPLLGVKYVGIRNRAFPSDLVGPQISGRFGYALSSAVIVQAEVGYTYNLSVSSSRSALGAPVGDLAVHAGLALPMAGNYALSLNYQGDVLAFNYVYRVAHGAAVGLGYSF